MADVTYTFSPLSSTQDVDWSDPVIWIGGVVPNAANADVVIPAEPLASGGDYFTYITIANDESYTLNSLNISANDLTVEGTLSVANALTIQQSAEIQLNGGTLSAGPLTIQGELSSSGGTLSAGSVLLNGGTIDFFGQPGGGISTGSLVIDNNSEIIGDGLTLTTGSLVNNGILLAYSGNFNVAVSPGGFANLSGTTLTGGTYSAESGGTLDLNVGGLIVTDAATISLSGGGAIASFDSVSGQYVPLQSTLQSVAPSGTLSLEGTEGAFDFGSLSINGQLLSGGVLDASQLTVGVGGQINGSGTIAAPIINSGIVEVAPASGSAASLDIVGSVAGSGSLEIGPGGFTVEVGLSSYSVVPYSDTLEVSGAVSQSVVFSNALGTLILDNPSSFSGTITPGAPIAENYEPEPNTGDQIILGGLSLSNLESYSYSGNATGGILTLQESSGTTALNFIGDFNAGSFIFSAGPQFLATSPPSLEITVAGTFTAVVNVQNVTVAENASIAASSLIASITNPNGDVISQYGFLDTGTGNGHFTVNGTAQPDGQYFTVDASALSSVQYVGGSSPGSETLDVYITDATTGGESDGSLAATTTGPIIANEVTVLYNDVLFRGATVGTTVEASVVSGNIPYWVSQIDNGSTIAQVMAYFVTSTEAQTLVDPIIRMYQAVFARAPDMGGIVYWVTQENNGVSLNAIAQGFVSSPEFAHDYGASPNPTTFIDALYENVLDRAADSGGLSYWLGVLGTPTVASEATVLLGFVNSAEYIADTQGNVNAWLTNAANGAELATTTSALGTPAYSPTLTPITGSIADAGALGAAEISDFSKASPTDVVDISLTAPSPISFVGAKAGSAGGALTPGAPIVIEQYASGSPHTVTMTGADLVDLVNGVFTSTAAVSSAIEIGGSSALTFGASVGQGSAVLLEYNGSDGIHIAAVIQGTAGTQLAADSSVIDLVDLVGLGTTASAHLAAANFALVA